MYRITIKGEAETSYKKLHKLDGIECQDEFSECFSEAYGSDQAQQSLIDKGVSNGYMSFKYEDEILMTYTTYDSPVELTNKELKILAEFTQGQWSDGIGEGFEQYPCYTTDKGKEIYISPHQRGQVVHINQEEVDE